MIHNLTPTPTRCGSPTTSTSSPPTAPAAQGIKPVAPDLDGRAERRASTRCSTCSRARGTDGDVHLPRRRDRPVRRRAAEERVDRRPATACSSAPAGHLHPGGLHDDLWLQRAGATAPTGHGEAGQRRHRAPLLVDGALLRAGGRGVVGRLDDRRRPPTGASQVQARATCSRSPTTYDIEQRVVVRVDGHHGRVDGRRRPAAPTRSPTTVDVAGRAHPRPPARERQPRRRADADDYVDLTEARRRQPADRRRSTIADFVYARGDMSGADSVPDGRGRRSRSRSTTVDAPLENGIWHTITACKAPCDRSTGIAYPLADGRRARSTPASSATAGRRPPGRLTWSTPTDLAAGTYTYFCRIHPFMRGAFRVTPSAPTRCDVARPGRGRGRRRPARRRGRRPRRRAAAGAASDELACADRRRRR